MCNSYQSFLKSLKNSKIIIYRFLIYEQLILECIAMIHILASLDFIEASKAKCD